MRTCFVQPSERLVLVQKNYATNNKVRLGNFPKEFGF